MNRKKNLAELIGIILGDGHLHKQKNCITIVGSLEEKKYYEQHVIPLIKSLFSGNPILRRRNDRNAYYIDFNSKPAMSFLLNLGMIRGHKRCAKIPLLVKSNPQLILSFFRGLFDTDGCLKFSKQGTAFNYYPRIQFYFLKSTFSEELGSLLTQIGFDYSCWYDYRFQHPQIVYQISGKDNLIFWFKQINPCNLVHVSKYLLWKKQGFYTPKSTLNQRLEALNLNIDEKSLTLA